MPSHICITIEPRTSSYRNERINYFQVHIETSSKSKVNFDRMKRKRNKVEHGPTNIGRPKWIVPEDETNKMRQKWLFKPNTPKDPQGKKRNLWWLLWGTMTDEVTSVVPEACGERRWKDASDMLLCIRKRG